MTPTGPISLARLVSGLLATGFVASLASVFPSVAHADFRLCNSTDSRVGVAVGYKEGETWVTEGWWNLPSKNCETLLKGPLVARFYYVYALDYDHGGEWGGASVMCTRDKEFTIKGIDNCLARGFDRTGFFEIDTGDQRSWTVQLTDQPSRQDSSNISATPGGTPRNIAGALPGTVAAAGPNAQ